MRDIHRIFVLLAVVLAAACAQGAELSSAARVAFDRYIAQVESRLDQQHRSAASFLHFNPENQQEPEAKLRDGKLFVEKYIAGKPVAGAMIHHWSGTIFIPGATTADFLRLVQDYDHLSLYYKPQVISSHLLSRSGNRFWVAMRLQQHRVITVVLDTEFEVTYGALDQTHGYSTSRSTQVSEIVNAGRPDEHALEHGSDHGFLWRLNSYWSFIERPDGLIVQCEAVSLTRDIPHGLGWLLEPFIQSIPRESLEFTLTSTRNGLSHRRNYVK
jgi:hypothetical protein